MICWHLGMFRMQAFRYPWTADSDLNSPPSPPPPPNIPFKMTKLYYKIMCLCSGMFGMQTLRYAWNMDSNLNPSQRKKSHLRQWCLYCESIKCYVDIWVCLECRHSGSHGMETALFNSKILIWDILKSVVWNAVLIYTWNANIEVCMECRYSGTYRCRHGMALLRSINCVQGRASAL